MSGGVGGCRPPEIPVARGTRTGCRCRLPWGEQMRHLSSIGDPGGVAGPVGWEDAPWTTRDPALCLLGWPGLLLLPVGPLCTLRGGGWSPVLGSLAGSVPGAQSGPRAWAQVSPGRAPAGLWDSVQASRFECGCVPLDPAPLPASLTPSWILASAPSWPEGGPNLCSALRPLAMAGKRCS